MAGGLDTIAVSIHGPAGVLDLAVPPGADAYDVAREYAEQTSLSSIPLLYTGSGVAMGPDVTLRQAGVGAGDVLVATTSVPRPGHGGAQAAGEEVVPPPGPPTTLLFWATGAVAALAGWFAARTEPGAVQSTAVVLLAVAVVAGVVPVGRLAGHRVLVAPAFAAAATYAVVWDPAPERLPLVVGIAGLAAAAAAAAGRSLSAGPDEALRVWMVAGATVFVLAVLAALAGFGPAVVWSVVLVVAVLAARFVPVYAVDVPDQYLIDLDRLAVTAWSAREPRRGRRGLMVVRPGHVAGVAASATRTMTAAAAAIAVAAALASVQLLALAGPLFDRVGSRSLVFFAGGALLLTARSHRHVGVRSLLRVAGLACWTSLAWHLLPELSAPRLAVLLGVAIGVGGLLVVVAVATGRGWRSVWWSRRAEVAEGFCAAAALASVVASSGLFRTLWEIVP